MNDQAARPFAGQVGACAVLVDMLIDRGIISQSEFFDRFRRAHVASGGQATARGLADIVANLEPSGAGRSTTAPEASVLSGQAVLVVEPEETLARELLEALENAGAEALVARSAAEALSRVAQFDFSAAVLDWRPERREHRALTRWLREDGVRVLFHAARPAEEGMVACGEPMLLKPAPVEDIVKALAQLVGQVDASTVAA